MNKSNFKIKSSSGQMLDVNFYETENPKGTVQLLHGMQEHKERYDKFANFLVENGYNVVIHDHLGHGKSISEKHPLGDMISMDYVVKDIDIVRKSIDKGGKYVCFGHSMGSFLSRVYSSLYPVDKLIACGTGQTPNGVARFVKFILAFNKSGIPLDNIQKLVMGPMGKKFDNPNDWLSYNKENQERYANDPLCGKSFTKEGYNTLLDITMAVNKEETYKNCTAKEILLISGANDPVGEFTEGVKKARDKYILNGKNVNAIFYEGMTHEILNENNNEKVLKDIIEFIN